MKYILLTITAFFMLQWFSCGEKYEERPLSKEALYYLDFMPGSYWIYRDSVSGETDSIALRWRSRRTYKMDNCLCIAEKIQYFFYSSFHNVEFGAGLILTKDSNDTKYDRNIPPVQREIYTNDTELYYLTTIFHDTFEVGKLEFRKVKEFDFSFIDFKSYFAKNVGLIKLVKYDFYPYYIIENWELIRYDVILPDER